MMNALSVTMIVLLGAILDIQFSTFYFPPPDGYDRILLEKSLI